MQSGTTRSKVARWFVLLGLLVWFVLLVLWARGAPSVEVDVFDAPSMAALLRAVRQIAFSALATFARYLPLGYLVVLALPMRQRWLDRVFRGWLPALLGSFLLARIVQVIAASSLAAVEPTELFVPWLGCFVGCWAAMAWTRGILARLLFLPELGLAIALLVAACAALTRRAIESSPLTLQTPEITSAEKRRVYALFAGKNPLQIEQGKTVDLRLEPRDLNFLLAWGLSVNAPSRTARIDLSESRAKLQATTPIAGGSHYLNLSCRGRP